MKYVVIVGSPNGTMLIYGPFASHHEANTFLNEEACPKLPLGYKMHVKALESPADLRRRKTFTPIGG